MPGNVVTHSAEETEALAAVFAARLKPGDVVALSGGLGAGKTAFVRGLARGLGCAGEVCSPTYAIMNEYAGDPPLAHFDMYRVEGWESLESTGFFDCLGGAHVLAVEWSENILAAIPEDAWRVMISPGEDENSRVIAIEEGMYAHPGG
jgi:tRNA threonylcarbamoyladenosine biosynthesis protein TsaE